jgi:succinate dehydrogenase/fumarate reductase cytochrome b subunit
MRGIALSGWLVIVGALLVWQGIGLSRGPEWPTLSDLFRAVMGPPLGRALLFGLWLWLGWHLFVRGWTFFLREG